jgi:hypothetical protein
MKKTLQGVSIAIRKYDKAFSNAVTLSGQGLPKQSVPLLASSWFILDKRNVCTAHASGREYTSV